jgi:ABC-type nitrate/sulfonate/bicarbonate transport system ATPase subunit
MAMTLDNMILILEQAFKTLKNVNDGNLILAIGNTGCGKSTMMSSLMFGSEALEIRRELQEIEVPLVGGGVKKKKVRT